MHLSAVVICLNLLSLHCEINVSKKVLYATILYAKKKKFRIVFYQCRKTLKEVAMNQKVQERLCLGEFGAVITSDELAKFPLKFCRCTTGYVAPKYLEIGLCDFC